ncbi:unnamed protein product [Caenorhabditis bovis]|uniref:Uncharacterized protein n=1 Tax=Caenorhabditis bovis TaxID=2654633 RepID=A0A8S1EB20_9PELO|nr:unnamed protein product [Caenorhabditis bovis]
MVQTLPVNINKKSTSEGLTSGYSTQSNSPEDSKLKYRFNRSDFDSCLSIAAKIRPLDSASCSDFIPVVTPNESEPHKIWYNKLLAMREEYINKERGAFPPFPPPPLPSVLIAASKSSSTNSFEEIKRANIDDLKELKNRFHPTDFNPLPPPHVFLEMIKTLAPHEYVDLTYALAGAVLLQLGLKLPSHYPPLPPKMEPIGKLHIEKAYESNVSSESSSDGEYSDDSEETKLLMKKKKEANMKRVVSQPL